jgi:outer membrane protein assembly factor BamB
MNRRTFCRLAAAGSSASLTGVLAGCVFGGPPSGDLGRIEDEWPMVGRDPGHTRRADDGPIDPDAVWVTDLEDARAVGTPALAAGQLFVPVDALSDRAHHRYRLHALEAATGEERWQVPLRSDPNGPPAVSGDRIVVSTRRSVERGRVVAFDDRYGEEVWLYDVDARVTAPPTVSAPFVYVPDWRGRVHALGLADGTVHWTRRIGDDGHGRSFPEPVALADDTLYLGSLSGHTGVVAIDADTGAERWSRSTNVVTEGPVIHDDLLVVRMHGLVEAFDRDGTRRWSYNVLASDSRPMAVDDRHVYVPARKKLYAIDRTGRPAWQFQLQDGSVGTPTVAGDAVLLRRNDHLTAVSRADGTEQWTVQQSGVGRAVVTPEAVFLARDDGRVAGLGSGST